MRVNIHDYSGHPFQVQLSRELAARGHEVLHTYCAQYVTGRGRLTRTVSDPSTLRIEALHAQVPLIKYSPMGRLRFELSYAASWRSLLERESFDLVVSCNVPLFALARMRGYFRDRGLPWLFWHQDIYSLGVGAEAVRRLPRPVGSAASEFVQRLERRQIASAQGVVSISEAMVERYREWGLDTGHVRVIPNWAPLEDVTPQSRNTAWAREQDLPDEPFRLLYAGTLGRKHNPTLLLDLLDGAKSAGLDCVLVVASEGEGAHRLAASAAGRQDVRIVGFQPVDRFGEMLSTADLLIALLESDAARFSVPSKVLSYLTAGRPIVALMPADNPAALDVRSAGGFVADPTPDGAVAAARWVAAMAENPQALAGLGRRARLLAEQRFDIAAIADEFEQAFDAARVRAGRRPLPDLRLAG